MHTTMMHILDEERIVKENYERGAYAVRQLYTIISFNAEHVFNHVELAWVRHDDHPIAFIHSLDSFRSQSFVTTQL